MYLIGRFAGGPGQAKSLVPAGLSGVSRAARDVSPVPVRNAGRSVECSSERRSSASRRALKSPTDVALRVARRRERSTEEDPTSPVEPTQSTSSFERGHGSECISVASRIESARFGPAPVRALAANSGRCAVQALRGRGDPECRRSGSQAPAAATVSQVPCPHWRPFRACLVGCCNGLRRVLSR